MTELLSPAGGWESMVAAVQNGADAVYMGFGGLNARRSARNFTDEEFRAAVAYCHLRGVKVYLTLNTLVTDRELPAAAEMLLCALYDFPVKIQSVCTAIQRLHRLMLPHLFHQRRNHIGADIRRIGYNNLKLSLDRRKQIALHKQRTAFPQLLCIFSRHFQRFLRQVGADAAAIVGIV